MVYVEPHRSILGRIRGGVRSNSALAEQRPPRVHVLDPAMVLPFSGYLRAINRWNYGRTTRWIRRKMREHGWGTPSVILASFPKHVDAVDAFPGVPVIYDVMDDYPYFYDALQKRVLRRMHRRLLARADVVVASSETLAERCARQARSLATINNGVSEWFVDECESAPPSADFSSLPRPRIGYVGSIAPWFDFGAVASVAEAMPHASVILVGPVETPPPAKLPPNVKLMGPRPHSALPGVLATFDVGIIPFLRTPEIDCVNPVKMYEYFAAGLPVVSTAFTEMLPFSDLVRLCHTHAEWVEAVKAATAKPLSSTQVKRQRRVARNNLWSQKAAAFVEIIQKLNQPITVKAA